MFHLFPLCSILTAFYFSRDQPLNNDAKSNQIILIPTNGVEALQRHNAIMHQQNTVIDNRLCFSVVMSLKAFCCVEDNIIPNTCIQILLSVFDVSLPGTYSGLVTNSPEMREGLQYKRLILHHSSQDKVHLLLQNS